MTDHPQDRSESDEAPRLAPAGKPVEDWTLDEHLAHVQAMNLRRPRRPAARLDAVVTHPEPGVVRETAAVPNPAGVRMIFTATTISRAPRACESRARTARKPIRRTRTRGAGRPARRRTRSTSGASSGDPGSGSTDPGDGEPEHHLERRAASATRAVRYGRRRA